MPATVVTRVKNGGANAEDVHPTGVSARAIDGHLHVYNNRMSRSDEIIAIYAPGGWLSVTVSPAASS